MGPRWLLVLAIGLTATLLPASPAAAYWDDVHYHLTYYVARRVGFTPEQASRLAAADLSTDYDAATRPDQIPTSELITGVADPVPSRWQDAPWRFHAFMNQVKHPRCIDAAPELELALSEVSAQGTGLLADACQTDAEGRGLFNAGVWLHFVQDYPVHKSYGSAWGHYFNPGNPLPSSAAARAAKLPLGGCTDWLSFAPVSEAEALVANTASDLSDLMRRASPRQKCRPLPLADYRDLVGALRGANAAPTPLAADELATYAQWVQAQYVPLARAPELTPEKERNYAKHLRGPDLDAAATLVDAAVAKCGMVEGRVPAYKAARTAFHYDKTGKVLDDLRDKFTLYGALRVTVRGSGKPVQVVVTAPATMAGEQAYDLTQPVECNPGSSATWAGLPVGDLVVEARRDGKVVRSKRVRLESLSQQIDLILAADQGQALRAALLALGFQREESGRLSAPALVDGEDAYKTLMLRSGDEVKPAPGAVQQAVAYVVHENAALARRDFERRRQIMTGGNQYGVEPAVQCELAEAALVAIDYRMTAYVTTFVNGLPFCRDGGALHLAGEAHVVFLADNVIGEASHQIFAARAWNNEGEPFAASVPLCRSAVEPAKELAGKLWRAGIDQGAYAGGTDPGGGGPAAGAAQPLVSAATGAFYRSNGGGWQPLESGSGLPGKGVEIRTEPGGNLALKLPDGTTLVLAGSGTVILGGPTQGQCEVQVSSGTFSWGQPAASTTTAHVVTPNAEVTNQHTVFVVGHDADKRLTTVVVREGAVVVKPRDPARPPLTVQAGQQVEVGPAEPAGTTSTGAGGSSVAAGGGQDEVRLRNGTAVRGRVVEITATTVLLRTETGLREIKRNEVAAVTYGE